MRDDDFSARIARVRSAAAGRWFEILTGAGIPESHLLKANRPCPLCGGRDRFTFFRKESEGGWFCRGCGHGDGIQLLRNRRQEGFMDTLCYLERTLGLPDWPKETPEARDGRFRARRTEEERRQARIDKMQALWDEAVPLRDAEKDDPVVRYLRRRQLAYSRGWRTLDLRSHPNLEYWEQDEEGEAVLRGSWPAMLARVTDEEGNLLSLHRTYLTEEGEKAPVPSPKKLMSGSVEGGLVRLYPVEGEVLAIAEGIETAMSVHALTGVPAWSAISVGGFQNVKTVPEGVKTLRIFGDNDLSFTGQAGAWALAARLRRDFPDLGISVDIPEKAGFDWNDVYARHASKRRVPGARKSKPQD